VTSHATSAILHLQNVWGDRDKATLEKRIGHLAKWNVKVYHTDAYPVYAAVISREKLAQTKAETHGIERDTCRMRHWFWCFKRKSVIISKSAERMNVTIALFARFRVNGDIFDIVKIRKTQTRIIS